MSFAFDTEDPLGDFTKQYMPKLPRIEPTGMRGMGSESETIPAMTPEEEESLAHRVARQGMGALSWVGESIAKPLAAVQGIASGLTDMAQGKDPNWKGGLLNLIPYSDTIGFTDPENRSSGRQLLEKWGALEENKPGLDLGDVAGFAADVAMDPLTYMTFGASALGKGGRALKGANVLDRYLEGATHAAGSVNSVKKAVAAAKTFLGPEELEKIAAAGRMGPREYRMTHTVGDLLDYAKAADPANAAKLESDFLTRASKIYDNPLLSNMPSAIDAIRNEKIGGLAGIGLPLGPSLVTIGHGPAALSVARKLDTAAHAVRMSSLGRYVYGMLDASVAGRNSEAAQMAARKIGARYAEETPHAEMPILNSIEELARDPVSAARGEEHRMIAEGVQGAAPATEAEARMLENIQNLYKEELRKSIEAGGSGELLQDPYIQFAARISPDDLRATIQHGGRGGYGYDPSEARALLLKQFKKGSTDINRVMMDKDLHQMVENAVTAAKQNIAPGTVGRIDRPALINDISEAIRNKYGADIDDYMRKMVEGKAKYEVWVSDPSTYSKMRQISDDYSLPLDRVIDMGGDLWGPHQIQNLVSDYGGVLDHKTGKFVDAILVPKKTSRYRELAIELIDHPEYWKAGIYPDHVMVDAANALKASVGRRMRWDTVTEMLGSSAPDMKKGFTTTSPGVRDPLIHGPTGRTGQSENGTLSDFFAAQGMSPDAAAEIVIRKRIANGLDSGAPIPPKPTKPNYPPPGAGPQAMQQYDQAMKAYHIQMANRMGRLQPVLNEYIRPEMWNDLRVWNRGIDLPEPLEAARNGWKSLTSVFKAGVLNWPARYVRDFISMTERLGEQGIFHPQDVTSAARLFAGQSVKGLNQIPAVAEVLRTMKVNGVPINPATATDEQASQAFRMLYSAHNNPAYRIESEGEGVARQVLGLNEARKRIIGTDPTTIGGTMKQIGSAIIGKDDPKTSWWKFWRNRGWHEGFTGAPLAEPEFGLSRAGDIAGSVADNVPRVAGFLNLLKKGVNPAAAAKQIADSLVDFNPAHFTPTERILKDIIPFYSFCVPVDHEIMTRDGWKTFDQLRVGEMVASYDHESGMLYWEPLESVNVFDHDGELIKYEIKHKSRKTSFLFTDNHRWPVITTSRPLIERSNGTSVAIKGLRVAGKRKFRIGCDLKRSDSIPCAGTFVFKDEPSILSVRHAKILGWVVTDGYFRWRGNYCEMVVYQSPGKHLEEILSLLGTKPRPPHPDTGVVCVPVALDDMKAITKVFLEKKDLERIVGLLSQEAAAAMWDAMFKAEGCTTPGTGQRHFAQSPEVNKEILNAFQMLTIMLGNAANISSFGCTIKKSRAYYIHKKLSRVQYTGKVWCPTTKHGCWVMRHNGSVVFTGNSSRSAKYAGKELMERPGGAMGQVIKATTEGRNPDVMAPDYVSATTSIPMGVDANGVASYLTGTGLMHEDPMAWANLLRFQPLSVLTELISRMNPLIKGPTEYASNRVFFQSGPHGPRSADDADPVVGRLAANFKDAITGQKTVKAMPIANSPLAEMIASNSPFARFLTTGRTLTDARKWEQPWKLPMQLLTGLRIADVSPEAQEGIMREQIAGEMRDLGAKEFSRIRFTKEQMQMMDTKQRQEAMRFNWQQNLLAKRSKMRAEQKKKLEMIS